MQIKLPSLPAISNRSWAKCRLAALRIIMDCLDDLYSQVSGSEPPGEEQAAPEVAHDGEVGRRERPAGCNGDWRGEGQPGRHRIGGRERHLVPCAVGIWRGLRILWREDGEQFVQVTVPDGDIL